MNYKKMIIEMVNSIEDDRFLRKIYSFVREIWKGGN